MHLKSLKGTETAIFNCSIQFNILYWPRGEICFGLCISIETSKRHMLSHTVHMHAVILDELLHNPKSQLNMIVSRCLIYMGRNESIVTPELVACGMFIQRHSEITNSFSSSSNQFFFRRPFAHYHESIVSIITAPPRQCNRFCRYQTQIRTSPSGKLQDLHQHCQH